MLLCRCLGLRLLRSKYTIKPCCWQGSLLTWSRSGTISLSSPKLLTKGDNNVADDTELYARSQSYLDRNEDLIGSVRGYIPAVGYVTIMLSEHPWMKTAMLGIMGVMVILQREQ